MRHSEFWERMDHHLGASYARTWAERTHLGSLGHRTVQEALDQGEPPLTVWRAVHESLELPDRDR